MIKFCIHHISSQLCTKIKVVHSNVQVFAVPWLLLNLCYLELIRKDCSIYTCMHLKFLLFGVLRIQFYIFACLTVKKQCFVYLLFVGISPAILSDFAKCWYIIKYLHLFSSYNEHWNIYT